MSPSYPLYSYMIVVQVNHTAVQMKDLQKIPISASRTTVRLRNRGLLVRVSIMFIAEIDGEERLGEFDPTSSN